MNESTVLETWLPVPDYEGLYEVSDLGRVRSLPRRTHHAGVRGGKIVKGCPGGKGYLYLNLSRDGMKRTHAVHSLVMRVFEGNRPAGMEVRHLNGDPADNRLANLVYGTHSENERDKIAHGTQHHLNKTHCPYGHEYSLSNTRIYQGGRFCRQCQDDWNQGRRSRR